MFHRTLISTRQP